MFRFILYISFLLAIQYFTSVSLKAQTTPIASLEILSPFDSFAERVALKYRIGDFLSGVSDPNIRFAHAQRYVEIAESLQDTLHMEYAYFRLQGSYFLLGDETNQKNARDQHLKLAVAYGWSLGDFLSIVPYNDPSNFLEVFRDSAATATFEEVSSDFYPFSLNLEVEKGQRRQIQWARLKL